MNNNIMNVLLEEQWIAAATTYQKRMERWITPHLERSALGEKHPVYDFLFEYYSYRPGQLSRWHPGLGTALLGNEADAYLAYKGYSRCRDGVTANVELAIGNRIESVQWMYDLLVSCQSRPPFFGCFGLHEWAMVYRAEERRHQKWPLRLSPLEIDQIVDNASIRCSHFDAFRFFTPPARGLNRLQPAKETRHFLEQAGCLHTNMDLYKWAFKLVPLTSSELIADTFELAVFAREIDMRASPYNFSDLGFEPIPIETEAGREEYIQYQRIIYERARLLREQLIRFCENILTDM